MSVWTSLVTLYLIMAIATLIPTLKALFAQVELNPGGASFESAHFSADAKRRLVDHYSRLQGTLGFWKREAIKHQRFHYYCIWWTILSSTIVPFLSQAIDEKDPASKWLLTTMSAHVALALAFHRGLKVSEHFKYFRHGESEFYDLYRRLLDRPNQFGANETEQIEKYFEEVEMIRRFVRNAETDSIPTVEDVREQMSGKGKGTS